MKEEVREKKGRKETMGEERQRRTWHLRGGSTGQVELQAPKSLRRKVESS